MSDVDAFTITVPLSDPLMRCALVDIAQAFANAAACVEPSRSTVSSGAQHTKPGSKLPAGNRAAVTLCRRLVTKTDALCAEVAEFEHLLDPAERKASTEFRATVKVMKAQQREADRLLLIKLYHRVESGPPM